MAKIPMIIDHFNTGLISQEVMGRVTSKWYLNALQECKNAIVTPYGNVRKRPGTKYIAQTQCSAVRMIPFIYNESQTYVLMICMDHAGVAGDNRVYFFTNGGFIIDSTTGDPYYIAFPYADTVDLESIQYVQKDDIMYFVCKGQSPLKLIRVSDTDWTLAAVTFNMKYIVAYGDGTAEKVSGLLPATLLAPTKVQLTYTIAGVVYTAVDDGAGNITGTDITKASIDYATGRLYVETSAAFDNDTPIVVTFLNQADFYPATVTFYENRLIVGNLPANAQVVMGSVIGSYEDFVFGTQDNNAFIYEIASRENNEITWLSGENVLLIGTLGAEYVATGGSTGITPSSISIVKQSEYGSKAIQPAQVGGATVFVNSMGNKLYSFEYNYQTNGYIGEDLNIINYDILFGIVKEMSVEKNPYIRIWCLLNDGTVAQLTYLRSENVMAWQTYETNGQILTHSIIPENGKSVVYMVIDRFGTQWIEYTAPILYNDYFDTTFVDCTIDYNGTATDTFDVPFPDGTELSVLTATGVHPNVVVDSGAITLEWTTTEAQIGLPYTFEITTTPIEIAQIGEIVTMDKPKSIQNLKVQLYKSLGGWVGMNGYYQYLFRTAQDLMNVAVPLFTGIKATPLFDVQTNNQVWISFKHTEPIPFNILSIAFDLNVGVA